MPKTSRGGGKTLTYLLAGVVALAASGAWAHTSVGNTAGQVEVRNETERSEGGYYIMGYVNGATGIVNNVSGTLSVGSWMAVGWKAGSYGELNIKSGAVTVNGQNGGAGVFVGYDSSAEGHLVVDGGSLNVKNDLIVGRNGTGTLTINGGTVEVGSSTTEKWTKLGDGAGSTGTINLNGGKLKLWHVRKGNGTASLVFNGGALVANGAASQGLIYSNLPVTVNPGGGTIDNGGFNVSIGAVLGGTGGLTFKGRGVTTLGKANTYTGATTIEIGTAVVVVSTDNIGGGLVLTVPATAPADGVYTVLSVSGDETLEGFTLPEAPENCSLRLSADKKSLLCIYGDPQNTWIGGESGSLSDVAGWSLGFVPTSGDSCVINNALAASLAVGDTFAPSAITFGEGCAPVTIDGGELSGITAITNLSSVRHVFNCAVSGNEIDFHNTVHCCEFRGGITVATPVFSNSPENANARAIVGDWTITSDWSPVSYNELGRDDAIGSSITVQGELKDPNNIVIYSGSVVTAATMMATSSTYPSYLNNGRLVINGLMNISTSKDFSLARTDGDNATIIAGGIVYNTGSWPWLNAKTLVLGADGIKFDSSHNNNLRFKGTPTLYARDAATTLHAGKDDLQAYSIANGKTLTVCTTKFDSSESSTITIDGKILETYNVVGHYSGGMAVTGNGMLVFNSESTFSGGLTVGDTATIKVNAGCTPGTGAITLGAGTTLALTATSKEFSLANALNLPTEGKATIRIDGKRLSSGRQEIAAVESGSMVDLDKENSKALAGRDGWLEIDDGKLYLTIKPDGTVLIIR